MSLETLKASAYDALAHIEYWQKQLRQINEEIANYKKSEKESEKEE